VRNLRAKISSSPRFPDPLRAQIAATRRTLATLTKRERDGVVLAGMGEETRQNNPCREQEFHPGNHAAF
jgi:hypothetical protein